MDNDGMRNLTCIVCPLGCFLNVTSDLIVSGNRCPRGAVYAEEEIRSPKRVVTATCPAAGARDGARRIPVKSDGPCPREKIPALLEDIYKTIVTLPVRAGDTVIDNWNGEGIKIVATRTLA